MCVIWICALSDGRVPALLQGTEEYEINSSVGEANYCCTHVV